MENKEKKQIPFKNYIILAVIIGITLLAVIYIFAWYKQYEEGKIVEPVITSSIREVEYNNLATVVKERDILVVYMCTTNENICRSFEKKFSIYLKDNNLTDNVVYLNLGIDYVENDLLNKVYNKYKSDSLVKKPAGYPVIAVFNQGKIVDILSSSKKEKLTMEQVKEFMESYELEL